MTGSLSRRWSAVERFLANLVPTIAQVGLSWRLSSFASGICGAPGILRMKSEKTYLKMRRRVRGLLGVAIGAMAFAQGAHGADSDRDLISAQYLHPNYFVRQAPSGQVVSATQRLRSGVTAIHIIQNQPNWVRIESEAGAGYVKATALRPTPLRGDFVVRSQPGMTAGSRIGLVRERERVGDLVLTGRIQDETRPDGRSNRWVEVLSRGQRAWIHAQAMVEPSVIAPRRTPAASAAVPVPRPRPDASADRDRTPAAAAVVPVPPTRSRPPPETSPTATQSLVAEPRGPECVSTQAQARGNERFRSVLGDINLFTTWNGPWGARIEVSPNGQATLHHPVNGPSRMAIQLCLSQTNKPYVAILGQNFFLEGSDFSQVRLRDPASPGQTHLFQRSRQ